MSTFQKLLDLLDHAQRRSAAVLMGLMLVGMVLETMGIGLVIPVLKLMTVRDIPNQYPALAPWLATLGNPTQAQLITGSMLVLVGIYALKAGFLTFLTWKQAQFMFGLQASLSQQLFTGYLRQPYTFHLQHNSAQLIRNVINEVSQLTFTTVIPGMTVLTEALVLAGITILLLAVEPLGALLVIATLGLTGWAFHHATKGRSLRWGEARQYHDGQRIQHLQQGLGGAKDVKLLGREGDFLSQYATHNEGSARMVQRQTVLQALPRLGIELLAVIGLAALVFSMLAQGKPMDTLLPTLGLFGAAAFRLMPSANRVIGSMQSLRYSLPVINTLHDELTVVLASRNAPRQATVGAGKAAMWNSIELDEITYTYPSAPSAALNGISISIPRRASVGFIGGSGAGKSTLIDVILGLLTPTRGRVLIGDTDIQTNLRAWQDQIGYVPQSIFLTDDTLRRNVAFGLPKEQIDDAAVQRALKAAQLEEFVASLPDGLETLVGERGVRLSGGQRQRIGIARALYHDPAVLVLDEATSSVDTATERGIMQAVTALQGSKTILIVAHRLSTVEQCDRLYRLKEGRVVEESEPTEIPRANQVV